MRACSYPSTASGRENQTGRPQVQPFPSATLQGMAARYGVLVGLGPLSVQRPLANTTEMRNAVA